MERFTVSEAREAWSTIFDRVEAGEEVVITRRGREVAVVMQPDAWRALDADKLVESASEARVRAARARRR